ncbi:winged helix-turn-helix transcriptional regulator [Dactylosporangium sp. NPDC051541]|uniref:winged helix-turn-helix transcriptional regulator n=1 Tax=Dactylosporangium sp. NPDC051541 TaxID=3363977 RepID=UPI0037ABF610
MTADLGDTPTQLEAGAQNAVAHALGIIGDEWTLLILRYATALGVRRYSDYLERLPISNSVLTNRLSRLAELGLMEKVAYQQRPQRFEYRLTKRGRDTWPILLAIWAWEATWVPQHEEQLPLMRHSRCGRPFQPLLLCAACGKPVEPRDVTGGFGPSGTWERSVPAATTRRRSFTGGGASPGLFPQTMALIGNRWSSALLGAAFLGAHRFKDFEQRLGAPPTMVADRLRTFCDLGVLDPAPGTERADWLSYHLTAKGRAFFPVVMCTLDWGHRWFKAPEGRALVYRHTECRRIFTPRLACDQCREPLRGGSDVAIERKEPS